MKTAKKKTLTNFNKALTKKEGLEIFRFRGVTNYPDTLHNKNLMSLIVKEYLKKLQTKSTYLKRITKN